MDNQLQASQSARAKNTIHLCVVILVIIIIVEVGDMIDLRLSQPESLRSIAWDFLLDGLPCSYQLCLTGLNVGEQMGTGVSP